MENGQRSGKQEIKINEWQKKWKIGKEVNMENIKINECQRKWK